MHTEDCDPDCVPIVDAIARERAAEAKLARVEDVALFVKSCAVGIAPRQAAVYEDIARRLREALDG